MAEGLFEERGSEDLATVAIQARSRLRSRQDVFGDGGRVRRCDPTRLDKHLREDLTAESDHVVRIRTINQSSPSHQTARHSATQP